MAFDDGVDGDDVGGGSGEGMRSSSDRSVGMVSGPCDPRDVVTVLLNVSVSVSEIWCLSSSLDAVLSSRGGGRGRGFLRIESTASSDSTSLAESDDHSDLSPLAFILRLALPDLALPAMLSSDHDGVTDGPAGCRGRLSHGLGVLHPSPSPRLLPVAGLTKLPAEWSCRTRLGGGSWGSPMPYYCRLDTALLLPSVHSVLLATLRLRNTRRELLLFARHFDRLG